MIFLAQALELNGESLNGRGLRLDLARPRGERTQTPFSGGKPQAQKIFVRGFDTSLGEDEVNVYSFWNRVNPIFFFGVMLFVAEFFVIPTD